MQGYQYDLTPINAHRKSIPFKQSSDNFCIVVAQDSEVGKLISSYFIGCDWLEEGEQAIYVQPKLDSSDCRTDYLGMLMEALKHSEGSEHVNRLYEIKMHAQHIPLNKSDDLITPLLVLHFLQVMKTLVRKGLKKGYYSVKANLRNKIKGKVLVGQTLQQNIFKGRALHNYCTYQEFGFNCFENRILKKALNFCGKYMSAFPEINHDTVFRSDLRMILPAFELVDEAQTIDEMKQFRINAFYKEYGRAMELASLIFKRFGYNLDTTHGEKMVTVPPFWIDMSKLFELFVWGKLKAAFGDAIAFQFDAAHGLPDFLLNNERFKFVIDAKYKMVYASGANNYDIADIRQISGYARDKEVMRHFGMMGLVIPCLIIHPTLEDAPASFTGMDRLDQYPIDKFHSFYKFGIRLPMRRNK